MTTPIAVVTTERSVWTDRKIYGLGDPVAQARVLDRPLDQWRPGSKALGDGTQTLRGPMLICAEDLWVSRKMLSGFEALGRRQAGALPLRLGRDAAGPAMLSDPLGRLPRSDDGKTILFDLWYLPEGVSVPAWGPDDPLPQPLKEAPFADLQTRVHSLDIDVDRSIDPSGRMSVSFTHVAAAPVGHWVELARANLLALGAEALEAGPVLGLLRLIWAAMRAFSLNPSRVFHAATTRGRRCRIHPTAVVEGCKLGNDVTIDAGAVLRGCVIGDGARIGPLAAAEWSVIGQGAQLQRRATANLSVIYPEARIGGLLQLSVAGRSVAFKFASASADMNPNGAVRVLTPDGLRSVDTGYQGICLGHEAFVAANLIVAPGRLIEGGRAVTTESRMIIRS